MDNINIETGPWGLRDILLEWYQVGLQRYRPTSALALLSRWPSLAGNPVGTSWLRPVSRFLASFGVAV